MNLKSQYQQEGAYVRDIPSLSETFFDVALKNFVVSEKEVCISKNNALCKEKIHGFKLSFDVEVFGIKLPSGYLHFDANNKIVKYKGPIIDITSILSEAEARSLVENSEDCISKHGVLSVSSESGWVFGYGNMNKYKDVSHVEWAFKLLGKSNEFKGICYVDAVTSQTSYELVTVPLDSTPPI